MAWRGVHISRPARLSFRDGQLIVAQEDGEVFLAIEDIAWLVLDTPQTSVTGALLSALAGRGVAMIVPDAKHHPAGVLLPFHQHHAQAHVAHMQVGIGLPLKKRLWQALVVAKIGNQAALLDRLDRPRAKALSAMAGRVGSERGRRKTPLLLSPDIVRDELTSAGFHYAVAVTQDACGKRRMRGDRARAGGSKRGRIGTP